MAVIAIYSAKGGVGKTTIASNLAWCSATQAGHSTLLWDLDAAGGAGFLFGVEPKAKRAGAMFSRDEDPQELLWETGYENLDLLPADDSLRQLDSQLLQIGKRRRLGKLANRLGKQYERIVLDCPPGLGEVSSQVLRTAEIVIVPLPPSPLSHRAFDLVRREIKRVGEKAPSILPVLSMVDVRRKLHREAVEAEPSWPVLPYSSPVEQCAVRNQPVGAFAGSTPAAQQFARLWQAIDRKLGKR